MFAGRSLFLRIFVWFWMTVVVTGIALILTLVLRQRGVPNSWEGMWTSTARHSGSLVIAELDRGGPAAADAFLQQVEREAHLRACLFEEDASVVAGAQCAYFGDILPRVRSRNEPALTMKFGIARAAVSETGKDGHRYIYATELPFGPQAVFRGHRVGILLEWCVALLVSGTVCYLLARHFAMPILHLRMASQRLAMGELGARASIEPRNDELGALVIDFNRMADRLEQLVTAQRQLIGDISHELRSPLARLNVALDLAREGKSGELPYQHMQQDLDELDGMIGRLLTIARLDAAPQTIPMSDVNLTDLVAAIARDAEFESHQSQVRIELKSDVDVHVQGNCELLHSAVENIVRNAIHYTRPGTVVEIELRVGSDKRVLLTVRDHGPGIPQEELSKIFHPFYRVTDSRDRASGGSGLGLAIADRVIRLHQGSIRALKARPDGLCVFIEMTGSGKS